MDRVIRTPGAEPKTHFKISEVARIFGLTVQTLHYWLKRGRIRRRERTSERGQYLIPRRELVRLLSEAGLEVEGLWTRPRPKVLLIDDDRSIRSFALAAGRSPSIPLHVKVADSVEDGLLLAAQFLPDVVFLDTTFTAGRLRGDQGLSFIRGTRLLGSTRVVALVPNQRTGAGMLKGGADGVLLKPFGLAEFRIAIFTQVKTRGLTRSRG